MIDDGSFCVVSGDAADKVVTRSAGPITVNSPETVDSYLVEMLPKHCI